MKSPSQVLCGGVLCFIGSLAAPLERQITVIDRVRDIIDSAVEGMRRLLDDLDRLLNPEERSEGPRPVPVPVPVRPDQRGKSRDPYRR